METGSHVLSQRDVAGDVTAG